MSRHLDGNGYAQSLLPTEEGRCYLCGRSGDTCRHEVFYGTANRANSKKYGTWVNICPRCHNEVHNDPNRRLDAYLKINAQWWFEQAYSRDEFVKVYGRSWL